MPITVSANQMITRALVDLRVLGVGRSVTKAHTDVAFPYLQEIVDSWKTNRWATYRVDRNRFAIASGHRGVHPRAGRHPSTSRGTGASLAYKPHWLTSAKTNQPGDDYEYPRLDLAANGLAEPGARRAWTTSAYGPSTWSRASSTTRCIVWPVPESPTYDLLLATPATFEAFANLDTEYPPPGGLPLRPADQAPQHDRDPRSASRRRRA